jgi:hypothetical protein
LTRTGTFRLCAEVDQKVRVEEVVLEPRRLGEQGSAEGIERHRDGRRHLVGRRRLVGELAAPSVKG